MCALQTVVSLLIFLCHIGFWPEAPLLASLILCTVCVLCGLLQPTVCLKAVWILASSYWREVGEPCGADRAVMMIFTMSDNEGRGNPRLRPRTNTQTHAQCHRGSSPTEARSHPPPNTFTCDLTVWVKCIQGNQSSHNLAPRSWTCPPQKAAVMIPLLLSVSQQLYPFITQTIRQIVLLCNPSCSLLMGTQDQGPY